MTVTGIGSYSNDELKALTTILYLGLSHLDCQSCECAINGSYDYELCKHKGVCQEVHALAKELSHRSSRGESLKFALVLSEEFNDEVPFIRIKDSAITLNLE